MFASRVVSAALVVGIAGGATVIACGGSGSKTPDSKVYTDVRANLDSPPATGIGKDCTQNGSGNPALCPTSDSICTHAGPSGKWFCTEGCGTSACAVGGTPGSADCLCNGSGCSGGSGAANRPMTPTGGDAICMMQKSMTTATPYCALYGFGSGSGSQAVDWACGLICGMEGGTSLGTCPPNLTCMLLSNQTYGICD
jgi:hypothetical protein